MYHTVYASGRRGIIHYRGFAAGGTRDKPLRPFLDHFLSRAGYRQTLNLIQGGLDISSIVVIPSLIHGKQVVLADVGLRVPVFGCCTKRVRKPYSFTFPAGISSTHIVTGPTMTGIRDSPTSRI